MTHGVWARVGASSRPLWKSIGPGSPASPAAGVTAEGMGGHAPLSGRHPVQGAAATRHPLAPSASVRRERFATSTAVMPAKAGIQYPPGCVGLRKRRPLDEERLRQRRGLSRTARGYWIPVFGFAETGMTHGVWARVGVSSLPLWKPIGPGTPASPAAGVTAEGMGGRAPPLSQWSHPLDPARGQGRVAARGCRLAMPQSGAAHSGNTTSGKDRRWDTLPGR